MSVVVACVTRLVVADYHGHGFSPYHVPPRVLHLLHNDWRVGVVMSSCVDTEYVV